MLLTSNNLQQIIIFSKIKHTYIQTLKNGKAHQQKGHDFSSSRAFNFQAHATLHKIRIDSKVFCQKIIFQELFPAFPLIFEYEARKYSTVWRTLCGPWVGTQTHVPTMGLWPWLSMPVTENSSLLFSFSHLQLAIFIW